MQSLLPRELTLRAGQWFQFTDANGPGHCQPDAFIIYPQLILLCEMKLTQRDEAFYQMDRCYRPVLQYLYHRPIAMLQICRNLRYRPPGLIDSLSEFLFEPRLGQFTHHLAI